LLEHELRGMLDLTLRFPNSYAFEDPCVGIGL
jgi:hypothetical protein